jgi:hypothetical protein
LNARETAAEYKNKVAEAEAKVGKGDRARGRAERQASASLRDVQKASVNDARCFTLAGNVNNTHKHKTGQGVSVKVAAWTACVV